MKGIESRRKRVEKVSESERNLADKVERIEEAGERWREQRGSMEFGRKKEERIEKVEEVDEVKHEGVYRDNGKGNSPDEEDRDDIVGQNAVLTDEEERLKKIGERLSGPIDSYLDFVGDGRSDLVDELKLERALKTNRRELEELQDKAILGTEDERELLLKQIQEKLDIIKTQEKQLEELSHSNAITRSLDMIRDSI